MVMLALVVALVGVGTALAARGDPQKRITPADQSRAKAMLLRKNDVGREYVARRTPHGGRTYCKATDESDLALTGEAYSLDFDAANKFISSKAEVYESRGEANTSWQRETSAAALECGRKALARSGGMAVTLRRRAFPRLTQRSIAYRYVFSEQGVLRYYVDAVALQQSRAHAGVWFTSTLKPFPSSEQVRLVRILAARMAKAMARP
jgi:hypothetical protein